MATYSIEEILNAVYSGTTLSGTASAAEILNTVFNGTDALQISGGGLSDGTVDGNVVVWDDTAGEWVEATLTEAGLAPIAPSTAAGQLLVGDASGGWEVSSTLTFLSSELLNSDSLRLKTASPGQSIFIQPNGALAWEFATNGNMLPMLSGARNIGDVSKVVQKIYANTGIFYGISMGVSLTADVATADSVISGQDAYPSATVNLEGGDLTDRAGAGATGTAGAGHGGARNIYGGDGYGTGDGGAVNINGGTPNGTGAYGDVNLAPDGGVVNLLSNLVVGFNKIVFDSETYNYLEIDEWSNVGTITIRGDSNNNSALTLPMLRVMEGSGVSESVVFDVLRNGEAYITGSLFGIRTNFTPSGSADTTGSVGDMAWDDNYIYVKTSAGWAQAALTLIP